MTRNRDVAPREVVDTPSVFLADLFQLRRRYTRSVNLERDLAVIDSIDGYVPTARALEVLERVTAAQVQRASARAWTLTGVYGTGKSALAHFAAALYGPADDPMRRRALAILRAEPGASQLVKHFKRNASDTGFVRAVATARREPVAAAVVRALARGAEEFWSNRPGPKPAVLKRLRDANAALAQLDRNADALGNVTELVRDVARAAQSGLLLVIDELGKTLEFAASSGAAGDIYLLQELAELAANPNEPPLLLLGLLHQAYSEYGQGLTVVQRTEWEKVQGRFEDVPFAESSEQTLRIIGRVIEPTNNNPLAGWIERAAKEWAVFFRREQHSYIADAIPGARIAALYPLHPVAGLVLPALCSKYAQNDRSLFTFLTSNEPNSLARFLAETPAPVPKQPGTISLPMLKVPRIYDYFVDAAGSGLVARPQFQRWAEVHSVIRDATGLAPEELDALKVVGTLNLVSSTGPIRASRQLCVAALLSKPGDSRETESWRAVLNRLQDRGLLTYRQQVDEYRIWEGSDFDVEGAIRAATTTERRSLAEILASVAPLSPIVAQRHSYRTGTLRYFERRYVGEHETSLEATTHSGESDGIIAYWASEAALSTPPASTADGRPLVVIPPRALTQLKAVALEYAALVALERGSTVLQSDGVARREVRQRLSLARAALDKALDAAFNIDDGRSFWAGGERRAGGPLGAVLSELCERTYYLGPVLWNELINRRELTSQGARARRELIEALLTNGSKPRLGLVGDGPEVSMYASVLLDTGIHREMIGGDLLTPDGASEVRWTVGQPTNPDVVQMWDAIEGFCLAAIDKPQSIDALYALLEAPPFGIKRGMIPLMLAAVLVYHADDVTVYRDGTFLPTLGAEHFELLVKQPSRFSVKHFSLAGIRLELFHDLENVLRKPDARFAQGVRNTTLLGVVRPLVRFVASLPAVTRKTKVLSAEAVAVRDVLSSSTEPDALLFDALPIACGFEPFGVPAYGSEQVGWSDSISAQRAEAFRHALFRALRELQSHNEVLLEQCRTLVHSAFAVRSDVLQLRDDLRVRAQYLVGRVIEPRLKSFVAAAASADATDQEWLESLVMIVADRPLETWNDEEVLAFEVHVSDMARRFANLEALQKEGAREGREGFDARRITVTNSDGAEIHRLVWIGREERRFVEQRVDELLALVRGLPSEHQRHAVAMAFVEELLAGDRTATNAETNVAEIAPDKLVTKVSSGKKRRARGRDE